MSRNFCTSNYRTNKIQKLAFVLATLGLTSLSAILYSDSLVLSQSQTAFSKAQKLKISCSSATISILDFKIETDCRFGYNIVAENYSSKVAEIETNQGYSYLIPTGVRTVSEFPSNFEYINIRKHLKGSISRQVKVNCKQKKLIVWGLEISPKCTSEGTYGYYENNSPFPVELRFGNQVLRVAENKGMSFRGKGTFTSNGSTASFTITPILN